MTEGQRGASTGCLPKELNSPVLAPPLSSMQASGGHLQNTVPTHMGDLQLVDSDGVLHQVKPVVTETPKDSGEHGSLGDARPDHTLDAASVHSMPAVHVTEPTSPVVQGPSSISAESSLLSTSPPMPEESSITQQQRRARHRSAMEVSFVKILQPLPFPHQNLSPASLI